MNSVILICVQSIWHQITVNTFHRLRLWQHQCSSYHVVIKLGRNEVNARVSNANAYRMFQSYLFNLREASFNKTIIFCSLYFSSVNILKISTATTTKVFNTILKVIFENNWIYFCRSTYKNKYIQLTYTYK